MKTIKKDKVVIQSQIKSGAKLKTEKGEENEEKDFVYGVYGHEALLTTGVTAGSRASERQEPRLWIV